MTALLDIRALQVRMRTGDGWLHAVDGVDLRIDAAETVCVVGESGCGKSTTALAVLGLLPVPPTQVAGGQVLWQGRDLLAAPPEALRRLRGKEIAIVFQEPMTALNPVYTVGAQIAEAVRAHEDLSRRAALARAAEMLAMVHIPFAQRRVHDHPHQFSGGMRQRVMIAMALACGPRLLIADEPTTALDATIQAQILHLLEELKARMGLAVMLITHAMGVVAQMAQRVAVMYAGQVVEEASAVDLFARPRHPYTQGLMRCVPRIDAAAGGPHRLAQIPGAVPKLVDPGPGCRFAPRCPHATPRCTEQTPALREAAPQHKVACILDLVP
jgi:peptide/nickel transport system ATP-binding protein